MTTPISITIAQREDEKNSAYVREVRFFGWCVKREEIFSEGLSRDRPIGFESFPDERTYIDEEE